MASRTAATAKKTAPAKATAKKTAAKPTPVRTDEWKTNVDEKRVNEQVLHEELRARGLETRGATMALVRRLEQHICSNAGSVRLAACDCGGKSLVTDRRCPYCGSADEVITEETPKPDAPSATSTPLPVSGIAPRLDAVAEPELADAPEVDALAAEPEEDAPEVLGVTGAAAIVPASSAATMSEEEAAAASAGLQPSDEEVKDLDRRVARVRELGLAFVTTGWDLGNELNQINDRKLFLARRLASGAPKYRSFAAFVESELNVDAANIRKFMAVAAKYSREFVLANGMTKMILVVQIPEGVRDQILSDQQAMSLPSRGLREVVSQIRGGADPKAAVANVVAQRQGTPAPSSPPEEEVEDAETLVESATASQATAKPAASPPREQAPKAKGKETPASSDGNEQTLGDLFSERKATPVDVVTMPGRFQVKLYALPKNGALGKKRRAFAIHEKPRGTYAFQNGAELRIAVHQGPSGMYLVCEMTPPAG